MNGDIHIQVCAVHRLWQILGGQLAASAQHSWLCSISLSPVWSFDSHCDRTDTGECRASVCHTGGEASFTRHEHVLCFTHGRRLLTGVDTRLKNNCASNNIIVEVFEMVTCPTHIQHTLKSMRHWFLTASCIFQNDLHVFILWNNQQMRQCAVKFISLQVHSTCFGRHTRPSSGV